MRVEARLAFGNKIIHRLFQAMKVPPEDYLALMAADVSERWNDVAKSFALPALAESSIQLKTFYVQDRERSSDYQNLYPVIGRVPPENWVFPKDRIVYEPAIDDGIWYTYHPGQFIPAEMILRISEQTKPHEWNLELDRREPTYESIGYDRSSYIDATNISYFGQDDLYTVFHYLHPCDLEHELPIKVFYKTHDEYRKLHALSIPLKLLGLALNDKDGNNDGNRRF